MLKREERREKKGVLILEEGAGTLEKKGKENQREKRRKNSWRGNLEKGVDLRFGILDSLKSIQRNSTSIHHL